jgi:hypothetical protein
MGRDRSKEAGTLVASKQVNVVVKGGLYNFFKQL